MKNILINIIVLTFSLITVEFGLRWTGLLLTSMENNGGEHVAQFNEKRETWFFTWTPNTTVNYEQDEFNYEYKINEWGNREKSISFFLENKDKDVVKIVCLGDSFTEGDGAPYDSTWVRYLEKALNNQNKNSYKLYNAGNSGSDIFYNYIQLKERLLNIRPEYVIELINDSDIKDVVYAGGLERFNDDGTVTYKTGRKWERLYINSHLFRLFVRVFFGYDDLIMKDKEKLDAVDKIIRQAKKTQELCDSNGIKYFLFFHITPQNIRNKTPYETILLHQKIDSLPFAISLKEKMINKFDKLDYINYSWEKNYHFNSYGYWEMGKFIYEKLREKDEKIIQ